MEVSPPPPRYQRAADGTGRYSCGNLIIWRRPGPQGAIDPGLLNRILHCLPENDLNFNVGALVNIHVCRGSILGRQRYPGRSSLDVTLIES